MANENQSQQNLQETASSLQAAQQQYATRQNDAFKESINLLNKMNKLLDDSVSKTQSFEKSTINIKRIEQERERVKRRFENLAKEINRATDAEKRSAEDYLSNIKERKKLEEDIIKKRQTGQSLILANGRNLQAELQTINATIEAEEARLSNQKEQLDLIAKIQSQEGLQERIDLIGEELDKEKQIKKELGLAGIALKVLNKYLLFGKDTYGKMVEEAREGDKTTKKWFTTAVILAGALVGTYKLASAGLNKLGNAASSSGNFLAGMSKHSGTIVRDLTSGVSSLLKNIPLVGGLLGGLVEGFSALIDLMLGVDDYAVKIGRQLNMSAGAARGLASSYRNMSVSNGDIFITAEKLLESQSELASTLGIVNDLGGDILAKNIKLKDFAGIELDTRAKLAELSKISGQDATDAILAQVVGLKKATGINFQYQATLKEAASQSGYIGLQFSRYPAQMTKALLTVKAMGMELKQLYSIGDSFLDFESSISKEFEAQLLTGKEINLAKARQAFLDNDLATAAAEITRQVGSAAEFEKMKRIQQESLAQAMGMNVDQLSDMLKQQELLSRIGAKQGDSAREQLRLGLQRYGNEKALAAVIGEQAYQSMVNASTQEKLAAAIEKIKESIVTFVMESGLFEKVQQFIDYLTKPGTIKGIIGTIRDAISTFISVVGEVLADVIEVGGEIANFFTFGREGDLREARAYELGAKIRAGSLEMSRNVRGDQGQYNTVSVGGNVANSQVKGSGGGGNAASQNNTSMGGTAGGNNVNLQVTTYTVDTPKEAEIRYGRAPEGDKQTGLT